MTLQPEPWDFYLLIFFLKVALNLSVYLFVHEYIKGGGKNVFQNFYCNFTGFSKPASIFKHCGELVS